MPRSSVLRAIVFDLDNVLLTREAAWRYAVEESVVVVTGQRIDARPLARFRTRRQPRP